MLHLTSQHQIVQNVCCGDKSVSHRALILAAISQGKCVIRNISLCQDVLTTANCLRALGAEVEFCGTTATVLPIKPISGTTSLPTGNVTLNCGGSGTTARLLAGLVAGLGVEATFLGDESLTRRPMRRILEPLTQMGATFDEHGNGDADGFLFKNIPSRLCGAKITAQVPSAQVKSGVLLAALFACGTTEYTEVFPTRNHTEIMLKQLGADIECGRAIRVGKSSLSAFETDIANDSSSVAFLAALALLDGAEKTFRNVYANARRLGFVRILQKAGANISTENTRLVFGEEVADICVKKSALKPIVATEDDVRDAIDEIPVLCALAVATKGTHVFKGVSELRFKESDRIAAIISMAEACGQHAAFDEKNLTIQSSGIVKKNPRFDTFCDHRIAMSQAVLALGACGGATLTGGSECGAHTVEELFDVSFPQFLSSVGVCPLRFGLLGQSVRSSRSPWLISYLARHANVCCSYTPTELPPQTSDEKLSQEISLFDGVNITMPFKTRVARLLNAKISSVNTVGRQTEPTSTDGFGVVQSLLRHNVKWQNAALWIIGAGGAAEACVAELQKYGCLMQIFNRTPAHAEALTQKYSLARNITDPVGVLSFVPPCLFESQILLPRSVQFVFTAFYKGQTALEKQAARRGLVHISGLEMLFFQGAKSFSLWTGTAVQKNYEEFENEENIVT